VKPAPVTVAPLMVTGAVPVELMVTVFVVGVFTVTLPKATLVTLVLSVGTGTVNPSAKVSVTLPAVAVRVAVCAVDTGVTFAVNWALVLFVCTSAAGDIVTAGLLLESATLKPGADADALIVTVHRSVPVPPIDALTQESPVSCGVVVSSSAAPVPLRFTNVGLVEALLPMVSWPVACPATAGTKLTWKLYLAPAGIEMGRLFCPATENDCPVRPSWVTVTGTELEFTTETEALALFPTGTLPRSTAFGDATRVCSWGWSTTLAMQPERARQRPEESARTNLSEWKLKPSGFARSSWRSICCGAAKNLRQARGASVIHVWNESGMGGLLHSSGVDRIRACRAFTPVFGGHSKNFTVSFESQVTQFVLPACNLSVISLNYLYFCILLENSKLMLHSFVQGTRDSTDCNCAASALWYS